MPVLELRRHVMRLPGEDHLSQEGVSLARRIGESLGPFDAVWTSTAARAFETAIAMGFAVTREHAQLDPLGSAVSREISWDDGFQRFVEVVALGGATARLAHGLAFMLTDLARSLAPNATALLITHGGHIEAASAALLPAETVSTWGMSCGYGEGVRLHFDGPRCTHGAVIRVDVGP